MKNVTLLTNEERAQIPSIVARRNKFKKIIRVSLKNYTNIFSNCILISGKPGSGKTTLVVDYLTQLLQEGAICNYKRCSGHITPRSLFSVLKETRQPGENGTPNVLVLDDVDCLRDEGCLELFKAAFDTKSNVPTNRQVYYMTEDSAGFKYNGFGIIITNDEFVSSEKTNVHQQALLDRVQAMSIDLRKEDMSIYSTYLVEKMLNDNEDNLTDEEIDSVVELFNTDIRRWMKTDAFVNTNINFSTRLVKKFVDAQRMFGSDWKDFSTTYLKLNAYADLAELKSEEVSETEEDTPKKRVGLTKVSLKKKGVEPRKDEKGRYINERTNAPNSVPMQIKYRKMFGTSK